MRGRDADEGEMREMKGEIRMLRGRKMKGKGRKRVVG